MSDEAKETRIFFSWQSDSPAATNRNAIRNALKAAAKDLKKKYPTAIFVIDEATRETSGAINIATKIQEKLDQADIVFCDVTTVTSKRAKRACPNPNVSFELGYAVAVLGWERVNLLFNRDIGRFPADLPFDFVQNRTAVYAMKEPVPTQARKDLKDLVYSCIDATMSLNPKRPAELEGLSPHKIRHDRDVEQMRWLMEALHLPTIDELIAELPKRVSDRSLWYLETFRGVVRNSLFNLHDDELMAAVLRFADAWDSATKGEHYHPDRGGSVFSNPGDLPLSRRDQEAWDEIEAARRVMRSSLDQILARLHRAYLDIDIAATNRVAFDAYRAFHASDA